MGWLVLWSNPKIGPMDTWSRLEIELEAYNPFVQQVWQWLQDHIEKRSQPLHTLTGTIERILAEVK